MVVTRQTLSQFTSELKQAIGEGVKKDAIIHYTPESGKENRKVRIALANYGEPMIMRKGSRRYGSAITPHDMQQIAKIEIIEKVKTPVDKEKQWRRSWEKVVKRLEKSGLWAELLEEKKIGLAVGYENITKAYELYWKRDDNLDWKENELKKIENIKNVDSRLIKINEDGNEQVNTGIIWHMNHKAKVKKMNFGQWDNKRVLSEIKQALEEDQKYSTGRYQVQYDVSYEYNPEVKKAWYSEEYRDCGNGHYYLALDETHALYYETD